jgi:hypothetical protein
VVEFIGLGQAPEHALAVRAAEREESGHRVTGVLS